MQSYLYTMHAYAPGMHIFVNLHKRPIYGNLLPSVRIRPVREELWPSVKKILVQKGTRRGQGACGLTYSTRRISW